MTNRISKEMYYQEFEMTYKLLAVEGKSVVDIGADYGSSVDWFLEHGASHVTAFESDQALLEEMKEKYSGNPKVTVLGEWSGQEVGADILKVDCEGCEVNLAVGYLSKFQQFAVGLHPEWIPRGKYDELKSYMENVGAGLVYDIEKEKLFVLGKR